MPLLLELRDVFSLEQSEYLAETETMRSHLRQKVTALRTRKETQTSNTVSKNLLSFSLLKHEDCTLVFLQYRIISILKQEEIFRSVKEC